ncbi:choice-of-anchor I family protein [Microbacterium sp. NC79]|uniref:choice-of-anchor I family protein n=1 Tax=Microbacterium sp. NC79 TaxID=2851009 RepID=UPI001C2C9545|nr:choice-of-anchor I family protein [Microbacterium sp. NC79]MBV0893828.1 bifunctional metallophosphatase/5'-nucleotidase [Microbacterium sp. NC79]
MLSRPLRRAAGTVAVAAVACTLVLTAPLPATAAIVADPLEHTSTDARITLAPIGTFETGVFDESAAEIVAAYNSRLFVVNAQAGSVSVLDADDPAAMTHLYSVEGTGVANSIAVRADGLGVIAFEAPVKTDQGTILFFDANADEPTILGSVTVGALPDMVALSADGTTAVVANEGEPADDFSADPEGSVAVVSLPATVSAAQQSDVRIADFHAFEGAALPADVRVFGPTPEADFAVSRNLEPEYVTIDGATAYVTLQEANALATVDLATATVTDITALGFKDHSLPANALDPSDKDGRFEQRTYDNLFGMYMPDGIASYQANGTTYLVTANEGDAREWGDYAEPSRVKDLADDGYGPACANFDGLTGNAELGRLNVTRELGFNAEAGCYDELYAFGGRSFSIFTTDGTLVFDSGSAFEQITFDANGDFVNSNHTEANFEGRSDDKGPEPESVAVGTVGDRTYAFVGLERVGGIIVYDITSPADAAFVTYVNNRDFSVDPEVDLSAAGDLGAEGVTFIPASASPTGEPVLAVANEVSGTTTLFAIDDGLTEVQIVNVNDFHGRIEANLGSGEPGAAVLAGAISTLTAENPNTLFVSAGDNIGASTFTSFIDDDNPTIDALVASGLVASAIGNHEFDLGMDDLIDRVVPRFGGPQYALGANVYDRATGEPALDEYSISTVDGVRIAFIGTVTTETPAMVPAPGIAAVTFGDELEAANRVAEELTAADAADVIVLLTHNGQATESCADLTDTTTAYGELVNGASSRIDAIISGHTHQAYSCEIEDPEGQLRPVIQAHQYGTTLGQISVTVDSASKELLSISGALLPLADGGTALYPADEDVAAIVSAAAEVAQEKGGVTVGTISADILRGGDNGSDRGIESPMGNLIADVMLWATTPVAALEARAASEAPAAPVADIAFMNPGGLRADLLYGTDGSVTYRDVANVQPFANTITTVTLTGAQIKSVLEEQWQPEGASRPKLHLGVSEGFSYTYVEDAPRGEHIVTMTLNGAPIDPAMTYTVAANSFLANGGDNFFTFAEGTNRVDTGQADLGITVAYFAAHPVVSPAPLGRAVLAEEPGQADADTDSSGSGGEADADAHADADGSAGSAGSAADGSAGSASSGSGTSSGAGGGLANTGSDAPYGLALGASVLVASGLLIVALRRRRVHS